MSDHDLLEFTKNQIQSARFLQTTDYLIECIHQDIKDKASYLSRPEDVDALRELLAAKRQAIRERMQAEADRSLGNGEPNGEHGGKQDAGIEQKTR